MTLERKGRGFMVWTFTKSERMYQEWENWGGKFTTVGCFDFLIPDDSGQITGSIPDMDMDIIMLHPDTQYLLTVHNDGIASRFAAIVSNTGGAQDKFISELHRILDAYPFAAGVDIDLENGPTANQSGVIALAKRIYSEVGSRTKSNWVHWDLPSMYGDNNPNWMDWCSYGNMALYFDSCAIMSYAFSWSGSAPDAVSPLWWMDWIYDYAVTRINPEKIFMGVPGFGFRWQIYRAPTSEEYRGIGWTYLAALQWMQGLDRHDANQKYIPFAAFHDSLKGAPYMFLHIYDYMEGWDADSYETPIMQGSIRDRNYLVCYEKIPKYNWAGVAVEKKAGDYDELLGNWDEGEGYIAPLSEDAEATFNFNISSSGNYKIVAMINFPWWDKGELATSYGTAGPVEDWYPFNRKVHWVKLWEGSLESGDHTFKVFGSGSQFGTQFWGFRVCSDFSMSPFGGKGIYTLAPRRMKDINGDWVLPDNFILTAEVLRSPPAYAWVWYDSFNFDQLQFYNLYNGDWEVYADDISSELRQENQSESDAQIHLNWYKFKDLNISATMCIKSGNGAAGILFKITDSDNLYAFVLRYSNQKAELWQKSGGSWSQIGSGVSVSIKRDVWYTLAVRTRGNELKCWMDGVKLFDTEIEFPEEGGFGLYTSGVSAYYETLDVGVSNIYVPQEALDIKLPGGEKVTYGRIQRNGVSWIDPWDYFEFNGPGEEFETRSEDISADFDFFHTGSFAAFENSKQLEVEFKDRGIDLTNIYLGDALGFSIAYYSDIDNFNRLANLAKHKWGLKGTALWSLGQQDPLLFSQLP
jgi:hypothetical protein